MYKSTTTKQSDHKSIGSSTPSSANTAHKSPNNVLTYDSTGTKGHAEKHNLIATIYSYITSGLRGQDLADLCTSTIDIVIFLSSLIFRNWMIYIDIRALVQINVVSNKFPELPLQTAVVFRIIKALWPEEYEEQTTNWKITKRTTNQDLRSHHHFHSFQSNNNNYHLINLRNILFFKHLFDNLFHPPIQSYLHITPLFGAHILWNLILIQYRHHHLTILYLNHPISLTQEPNTIIKAINILMINKRMPTIPTCRT